MWLVGVELDVVVSVVVVVAGPGMKLLVGELAVAVVLAPMPRVPEVDDDASAKVRGGEGMFVLMDCQ